MELSSPKLKKLLIFRKNLQGFSSLFLQVFYFTSFLGVFISPTFFTVTAFLSGNSFLSCCTVSATDLRELFLLSGILYLTLLPHICHSTTSATDLREHFLLSGVFYLTLLPDIWYNLLLSRFPWEPPVLKVAGPPTEV